MLVVAMTAFMTLAWAYRSFVSPRFEYANMLFDPELAAGFRLPMFAAALLPVLLIARTPRPAHIFVMVIYFFVYLSILVVPLHFLGAERFAPAMWMVFAGIVIIAAMSNLSLNLRPRGFGFYYVLLLAGAVACLLPVIFSAWQSGLTFAGFTDIYDLRTDLAIPGPVRYGISIYTFSVGPFVVASALHRRRYLPAIAGLAPFALFYGLMFQKFFVFAPVLVLAMHFLLTRAGPVKNHRLMLFYAAPLFVSALFVWGWSAGLPGFSAGEQVNGLVLARMYSVPGQIFAHFADFFESHPYTYFSHISGVNQFIAYPYAQDLPLVMRDAYPGGNQNANFWAQDAIAGAGIYAIPAISFVFGLVLVLINTAARGLSPVFAITALSLGAQRFSDGTLATGLLSGGVALSIIFLFFAPRSEFGAVPTRLRRREKPVAGREGLAAAAG